MLQRQLYVGSEGGLISETSLYYEFRSLIFTKKKECYINPVYKAIYQKIIMKAKLHKSSSTHKRVNDTFKPVLNNQKWLAKLFSVYLLEHLENSWGNKQFGGIKAKGVLSALSAQRSRSLSALSALISHSLSALSALRSHSLSALSALRSVHFLLYLHKDPIHFHPSTLTTGGLENITKCTHSKQTKYLFNKKHTKTC